VFLPFLLEVHSEKGYAPSRRVPRLLSPCLFARRDEKGYALSRCVPSFSFAGDFPLLVLPL